jgi:Penicillin-insensitive murein endopeptidase
LQSSKCAAGATAALPINASLYDKLNFNFIRDIAPVAGIMRVPNVMEVHPCQPQGPVPAGDGRGKDLDYWFSDEILHPKPSPTPPKPKPPLTMADLPPACRQVLLAPWHA